MAAATALRVLMAAVQPITRGAHGDRVVLGKVLSRAGYMVEPVLTAGFVAAGMVPIIVGPLPTPAVAMLTRSLAKDLAPEIRVNGVSPGAILWPESNMTDAVQQKILAEIPLQRPGDPADVADCVLYLMRDAIYVTGQVIAVDGGRSVGW